MCRELLRSLCNFTCRKMTLYTYGPSSMVSVFSIMVHVHYISLLCTWKNGPSEYIFLKLKLFIEYI